jgi:GR25 family glycosyltransferase involved in LPS biosynthesis
MDNTIYINLNHRTDRREATEEQFAALGIQATRMEAIECVQGAIGCAMSHVKALEYAKEHGWPTVCICEDDIEFTNPRLFQQQLRDFLSDYTTWDVLLLGTNMAPPFDKGKGCFRVRNAQTTTGYIVKNHYYDTLIACFRKSIGCLIHDYNPKLYAIDIQWKYYQEKDLWYVLNPLTIIQRNSYSDIEKREVSYGNAMLVTKERPSTLGTYWKRI